jgi:hypothetical protein
VHRHALEPLAAAAHDLQVAAVVDEAPERVEVLPDGHVHDQAVVAERLDRGGVAAVVLQPPDEARSGVRQGVDGLQQGDELGQLSRVERRARQRDVQLG